jgi:hypothetical protein
MPSPSIGSVTAFTLSWKKGVPSVHTTEYQQPNRAGNSHSVGKVFSDASSITTEHFLPSKGDEKALLKEAADLCGSLQTVTETFPTSTIAHTDVFIKAFKVMKSNACVGGPSGSAYIVILEWTAFLPETW